MRTRGLVMALAAVLALSACGGGSEPAAPTEAPPVAAPPGTGAKLPSQLAAQKSYAFELTIVSVDADGKPVLGQVKQTGAVRVAPLATKN